jgi:hypothetical protein
MYKRKLKKLYGKLASLRDYEFNEAKKLGGIQFEYRGKFMTIVGNDLYDKQFQCHKKFWESKKLGWKNPLTGMSGYTLVDFVFVPDGGENGRPNTVTNRAKAPDASTKALETKPESRGSSQEVFDF